MSSAPAATEPSPRAGDRDPLSPVSFPPLLLVCLASSLQGAWTHRPSRADRNGRIPHHGDRRPNPRGATPTPLRRRDRAGRRQPPFGRRSSDGAGCSRRRSPPAGPEKIEAMALRTEEDYCGRGRDGPRGVARRTSYANNPSRMRPVATRGKTYDETSPGQLIRCYKLDGTCVVPSRPPQGGDPRSIHACIELSSIPKSPTILFYLSCFFCQSLGEKSGKQSALRSAGAVGPPSHYVVR